MGERPGRTVAVGLVCYRASRFLSGRNLFSTTAKYFNGPDGEGRRERHRDGLVERYIEPPGDVQSGGAVATARSISCQPRVQPDRACWQVLAYTVGKSTDTGTHPTMASG